MKTVSKKSRTGLRNLRRRLARRLGRRATRMLGGARGPRRPNELRIACRLVAQYLRLAQRMARRSPHLFGPHALDYFLETVAMEKHHEETAAALRKVYGAGADEEHPAASASLWAERYPEFAPPLPKPKAGKEKVKKK